MMFHDNDISVIISIQTPGFEISPKHFMNVYFNFDIFLVIFFLMPTIVGYGKFLNAIYYPTLMISNAMLPP